MNTNNTINIIQEDTNKLIIGHNKYQLKITEAQSHIDELSKELQCKNDEIKELNDNINTYKLQLNEANSQIEIIQTILNDKSNSLDNITKEFDEFKLTTNNTINTHQDNYNRLLLQNGTLNSNINDLNSKNDDSILKYQELKHKYQITIELLELKVKNITQLNTQVYNLTNELNIYKDNCSKQLSDITSFKQQLSDLHENNRLLQLELNEKKDYLGQLHKKLASEKLYKINYESTPQTTNESVEPVEPVDTFIKPVKITSGRGIKISKR